MKRKKKKQPRQRVEVNVAVLDKIVDKAAEEPLSQDECHQLRTSIHAMAARLKPQRTTEKAKGLLDEEGAEGTSPDGATENGAENGNGATPQEPKEQAKRAGHGRNGAAAYTGATKVPIPCEGVTPKCLCLGCQKGKLYEMAPSPLVRITGMPPIQGTVYELQQLRCNLCGEIYKAQAPEGIGDDKYDASVGVMVGQLKYGSGMPFNRIEKLQKQLGVPLPAGTQFDLVNDAWDDLQPMEKELTRQAAQGEVATWDDTVARILDEFPRPEGQDEDRTGLKTTGIVSEVGGHKIALFVTGAQHAGENVSDLLKHREEGLPPMVGMADALSCNNPKLPPGVELLMANCLTHARRQFVDIFESFPEEGQHVIVQLGLVYLHDQEARDQVLSREARLHYHQQKSGPIMDELKKWMEGQLAGHAEQNKQKAEANSGLGKALRYFLKRWDRLTLFLQHPGSPLDSNVVERALKKPILHRKNALFFKTEHGAKVGDLFMTIIHTCELNGVNSFHYMHQLRRHVVEVAADPAAWLPWNYHLQLQPRTPPD